MQNDQLSLLIVDDEPEIIELLTLYTKKIVGKVLTATNGVQALDLLSKNNIDLVFSDISMPEMTGIELLDQMARDYPSINIVLISAYAQQKELLEKKTNLYSFITKPVSKKTIKELIVELAPKIDSNKISQAS